MEDHISAGTETFCDARQCGNTSARLKVLPHTIRSASGTCPLTMATTLTPFAAAGGKVPDLASAKPMPIVDRIFSVGANAARSMVGILLQPAAHRERTLVDDLSGTHALRYGHLYLYTCQTVYVCITRKSAESTMCSTVLSVQRSVGDERNKAIGQDAERRRSSQLGLLAAPADSKSCMPDRRLESLNHILSTSWSSLKNTDMCSINPLLSPSTPSPSRHPQS